MILLQDVGVSLDASTQNSLHSAASPGSGGRLGAGDRFGGGARDAGVNRFLQISEGYKLSQPSQGVTIKQSLFKIIILTCICSIILLF